MARLNNHHVILLRLISVERTST